MLLKAALLYVIWTSRSISKKPFANFCREQNQMKHQDWTGTMWCSKFCRLKRTFETTRCSSAGCDDWSSHHPSILHPQHWRLHPSAAEAQPFVTGASPGPFGFFCDFVWNFRDSLSSQRGLSDVSEAGVSGCAFCENFRWELLLWRCSLTAVPSQVTPQSAVRTWLRCASSTVWGLKQAFAHAMRSAGGVPGSFVDFCTLLSLVPCGIYAEWS
jgi:hypothetical protein